MNVSLRELRADNNELIKIRYGVLVQNVLGQKYHNYLIGRILNHGTNAYKYSTVDKLSYRITSYRYQEDILGFIKIYTRAQYCISMFVSFSICLPFHDI